ncbi:MAG: UDP-glucose/GDP-mannose dehydrogenase family protein [Halothiobacillaceae bacterium]|nr:UDP-glucose/GDP-mannose dehydrogenase family protein [Halothiobacillaceae bacterium]
MKVTIFGSGYVGLVTGACLADVGNHVLCVDVDAGKIERLKQGIIPIHEPGLDEIIKRVMKLGRIDFTTDMQRAVAHSELQFIAVGTPPDEDGSADLRYVLSVAQTIAENMTTSKIVVDKSTVPVGTGDKVRTTMQNILAQRGSSLDFQIVSNPEFLKEGAAIEDFMKPDRIIIGTDSDHASARMRELYAPFSRNHDKMIVMDIRSAELTKYAANAMLATKISFMNEMAMLAERLGADIENVRIGIGSDPRIGYHFIYPGCGYGGSCFPKDVKALERAARDVGFDAKVLSAVEARNDAQKNVLFDKINRYFNGNLQGRTIALWGLAFKPNTDDMREAPSRVLLESLWAAGARVQAYDPVAMEECQRIYGSRSDLCLCEDPDEALQNADALAIVTEWKIFRSPNFEAFNALKNPVIFDGRNIYDPATMRQHGIDYQAIGRSI